MDPPPGSWLATMKQISHLSSRCFFLVESILFMTLLVVATLSCQLFKGRISGKNEHFSFDEIKMLLLTLFMLAATFAASW